MGDQQLRYRDFGAIRPQHRALADPMAGLHRRWNRDAGHELQRSVRKELRDVPLAYVLVRANAE
jgi:hypothetical protein